MDDNDYLKGSSASSNDDFVMGHHNFSTSLQNDDSQESIRNVLNDFLNGTQNEDCTKALAMSFDDPTSNVDIDKIIESLDDPTNNFENI